MRLLLTLLACRTPASPYGTGPEGGPDSEAPHSEAPHSEDTAAEVDVAWVYVLAGQSNMVGYGYTSGLPPELAGPQADVSLYWLGEPGWRPLTPVSWIAGQFGPEVTFGRAMADAQPARELFLIKVARGNTSLAECWNPEVGAEGVAGDCWEELLLTWAEATEALREAGKQPKNAGLLWMQGEADAAGDEEDAARYGATLERLIDGARGFAEEPELPVVMGLIDCPYCAHRDLIRAQLLAAAAADPHVRTVETEDLPREVNPVHLDASGQRTLGARFAAALLGTEAPAQPQPLLELLNADAPRSDGDYLLGYRFELRSPVEVTDVGALDMDGGGLADATQVALFDAESQALIQRWSLPAQASTPATPWGPWRYVAVSPLSLEPGRYVLASQVSQGGAEGYLQGASTQEAAPFRWEAGLRTTGLDLPTEASAEATSWLGPNLLWRAR